MITNDIKTAIEYALSKGNRVELIPGPNGSVKVLDITRKIIKTGQEKECSKN